MSKRIHIQELGHIVLYVTDLSRSVEFYRDVLGWQQIDSQPDMPAAAFSSGRTHHELLLIEVGNAALPKSAQLQIGLYHFGLKIGESDDDLRMAIEVLREHNVTFVGSADHHVTHSLYIEDPDGNQIELYIDVLGVDWKQDPHLITRPAKRLEL